MLEKRLIAVPPQLFTADGDANGIITVLDTRLFKVKQEITIAANTLPHLDELEVKRVFSLTQLAVGPRKGNIDSRTDVAAYTVVLGANIFANEQKRPSIPFEEFTRAEYEEEPVVAQRVIPVDTMGNRIDQDNPAAVQTGTWWDEADISRDGDDDITKVEFSKKNVLIQTIDLSYNGEKSVVKVTKS